MRKIHVDIDDLSDDALDGMCEVDAPNVTGGSTTAKPSLFHYQLDLIVENSRETLKE